MKKMFITLFFVIFINANPAEAVLLDFENLPDLTLVDEFYAGFGVHFNNAISLTAGFSLNEIDFPPSSGLMAIGDNFAPVQITFDNLVENIFANFTYGSQLAYTAFDQFGSIIGSFVNPNTSNLGSSELVSLSFTGVSSLIIAGQQNGSFIMDDFNFSPLSAPIPEPSTIVLISSGFLGLLGFYRKKITER